MVDTQAADAERGSVTAELAVLLPGIVMLLSFFLVAAQLGSLQLRAEDAARSSARLMARADPRAVQFAQQIAGDSARVETSTEQGKVTVRVKIPTEGLIAQFIQSEVIASATVMQEKDLLKPQRSPSARELL